MEPKDIQTKIDSLRNERTEFAQNAQKEINQKQQELAAMVKLAQKRIDNMEGAELALMDLLPEEKEQSNEIKEKK